METGDNNNNNNTKISHGIFSLLESRWLHNDQNLRRTSFSGGAEVPRRAKKVCVLSIDGGGMRGLMACQCLLHLQNSLRAKSGNPNAHISDYFDIAAGTNMGGIIVATLFTGVENGIPLFKSVKETLDFIATRGREMFQTQSGGYFRKKCKYSAKSLGRVLKSLFSDKQGNPLTLRQTSKPVLIPCYDLITSSPFVFSRAGAERAENLNFNIWEVCRATVSFPGLYETVGFSSVDGRTECAGIDGGLVMNNPTAAAITHVMNNKLEFPSVQEVDDLLVLSLGGGQFGGKYEWEKKVKGWRSALRWAKPVMDIVMTSVSDIVDHAVSLAFSRNPQNYLRIQATKMPEGVSGEIYDASEEHVKALLRLGESMMKEKSMEYLPFGWKRPLPQSNAERLDWFAEQLVLENRFRVAAGGGGGGGF